MGIRLINFLRGYVSLLLTGPFIERFINICMHRGIFLWAIRKTGEESAQVSMSIAGFRHVPPIARKTKTRVKITGKHGLPIMLNRYRHRQLFLVGLLLSVCFLYVSSLFLWSVSVVGNEAVSEAEIKAVLAELGVRPGVRKKEIDVKDVKNRALMQLDTLSWLWVDIKGCRATVRVTEKRAAPEILPDDPCDIVAGADGIITQVHATEGQKAVEAGDTVLKGQLLISSVFTSERAAPRYTHAAGEVFARTWYEKEMVIPLTVTEKVYTQNVHVDRTLHVGSLTLPLSRMRDLPFSQYDHTHERHDLVLFGKYLGLSFLKDSYAEYTPTDVTRTVDEAVKAAEAALREQVYGARFDPNAQEVSSHTDFTENGDGSLTVTLTVEFVEQIGTEKAVEIL